MLHLDKRQVQKYRKSAFLASLQPNKKKAHFDPNTALCIAFLRPRESAKVPPIRLPHIAPIAKIETDSDQRPVASLNSEVWSGASGQSSSTVELYSVASIQHFM